MVWSPPYFFPAAFSPGMPAVISIPPCSRSFLISSSYWPRKRKPWDRVMCSLLWILSVIHVVYLALSVRHISHCLAFFSNSSCSTMGSHFLDGYTASPTPPSHEGSIFAP